MPTSASCDGSFSGYLSTFRLPHTRHDVFPPVQGLGSSLTLLKYLKIYFFLLKNIYLVVLGLHHCMGFSLVWRAGATLVSGAWASHCSGFSCCQAQALQHMGSVVAAPGL